MSHYFRHRQAIGPILFDRQSTSIPSDDNDIPTTISPELTDCILQQGLAGHWFLLLGSLVDLTSSQAAGYELFQNQIRLETGRYLAQLRTIHIIHKLFKESDIRYALYKGAHIREVLYDPPSIRPAADIDVLISPWDRNKAAAVLVGHDFEALLNPKNINVEASFCYKQSTVDLHWNVFREKRSKIDLVEPFLKSRIQQKEFYSLCPEHALVVMLTHPVFFKYLTSPVSSLSRVVDIYRLIKTHEMNWGMVLDILQKAHLTTAAWLTGYYCELLTGTALPEDLMAAVTPKRIKTAYLKWWVKNDLSTKFFSIKAIPQIFFTLPAHDNLMDAFGLLLSAYPETRQSKKVMAELEEVINSGSDPT